MTRIAIAKKVTSAVVSYSVGRVLTTMIRNNVPQQTLTDKVAVETSAFVIGGMVAQAASKYTDDMIDQIVAVFKQNETESEKS